MAKVRCRSFWALLLAALVGIGSETAHAAEPPGQGGDDASSSRVADLNEAGARHYAARSYRQAIEKFIEAYSIDHDPNLLFNIARCYEELGETAAAIEKYEAFIAAPGADADGRLKAEASLRSLRQLPRESPSKEDTASEGDASTEPSPRAGDGGPGPSKTGFFPWLVLGAGVVTTGLGATFYALGASDHSRVTSAPGYGDPSKVHPMTEREAGALVESGNTKKVVGGIGLGLGGALIATSVVLLVASGSHAPAEERTALRLSVDPGPRRLAVAVTGSF